MISKRDIIRLGLFLLLLLPVAAESKAQDWVLRVGGGLSSHYGSSTRNIGAFRIGAGYDIPLNALWSIEPAVYYFAKGWKDKDQEVPAYDDKGNYVYDEDGNQVMGLMNVTSNANYIEIPVLLHYKWETNRDNNVLFSFGPYAAYGIGGKTKVSGDTEQTGVKRYYYDHSTFGQTGMHRFDAGLSIGASYRFAQQFEVGVLCDLGLTRTSRQGGKNMAVVLTLAYRL